MSLDANPVRATATDLVLCPVRFVGGASAVTEVYGEGVTVTYIGAGLVDLTFSDAQGLYRGLAGMPSFEATTAADVKGHTCVPGVYNTTTRTLRLNITNASETLHDLAALEWLSLTLVFQRGTAT
jgi:hypothetical protein